MPELVANFYYFDAYDQPVTMRREERQHRQHLVVPAVMLVEGVLNGELIQAAEFDLPTWNGIPIVMGHPMNGDQPVSANSPDIPHYGRVYAARVEGTQPARLAGDLWLDVNLCEADATGRLLVAALAAGQILELSLAWWRTLDVRPGVYGETPYVGIARNLWPDHLAILLDGQGACDVSDGCGVPRTHRQEDDDEHMSENLDELTGRLQALTDTVNALQVQIAQQGRAQLEQILIDNGFESAELSTFSPEQLTVLARRLAPADYSGRGGAVPPSNTEIELSMPALKITK